MANAKTEETRKNGREKKTFSLTLLFALSVMLLLTGVTLFSARIILDREQEFLEAEAERRILAQCRSLASLSAAPLLDEFPEFVLTPLIKDIVNENEEIAYTYVVDPNGKIRGSGDIRDVANDFEDNPALIERNVTIVTRQGEQFRSTSNVVEVSVPIRYSDGTNLGRVYLAMQMSHIQSVIDEASRQTIKIVAISLLIGLLVTYLLVSNITRPINLLTKGSEEIAKGNLDHKIKVKSRTEIGRLAWQFNEMTSQLKVAQDDLVEKERLGKELEIASEIEDRLLPKPNLAIPGYDITGFHQSAQQVGGDYYDVIPLDEEHVGITVADVAGKGIPGLVVMAMTSALLRTHGPRYKTPSETLIELNRMLQPNMRRGMFITMFYGILHLPSGRLAFAGAGHNPLIHFRRESGLQSLMKTTGVPLGLFTGPRFDERVKDQTIVLGAGDGIVQYTDGVNEAVNQSLEEFGLDSLVQIVAQECGRSTRDLVDSVVEGVFEFAEGTAQFDDITLLSIKRKEPSVESRNTIRVMA